MTSDQVRFIREVFRLSPRDLAKALNVAPNTVARWELSEHEGGNSPAGLQEEVLRALHSVALQAQANEAQRQMRSGLILLGIGALIFYLLTQRGPAA